MPHARLLIGRVITIIIIGIGVATILDTVGVPLTTFVTVLGVAGLGISLAMQDMLKSFVAGTFLLFERPFRIGDEISVKDQRGVVEHIGIRTTRLRNADNVQIHHPERRGVRGGGGEPHQRGEAEACRDASEPTRSADAGRSRWRRRQCRPAADPAATRPRRLQRSSTPSAASTPTPASPPVALAASPTRPRSGSVRSGIVGRRPTDP